MTINVVIGASWGDEGKGLMTDYFASKAKDGIVIRFNGGAQAGHTVTASHNHKINDSRVGRTIATSTRRHVFSHFGSGSLLGVPTFLSKYFVLNPVLFNTELKELRESSNVTPTVFIDPDCYVTLPFDVFINQILEDARGKHRHGSVGVGFGETIERNQSELNPDFHLNWRDVIYLVQTGKLKQRIERIVDDYYSFRLERIFGNTDDINDKVPWLEQGEDRFLVISQFIENVRNMLEHTRVVNSSMLQNYGDLIFEGAQGLLLDPKSGNFPHVTRSNCGLDNVIEILNGINREREHEPVNITYVSRIYLTRHGAGLFNNEQDLPYDIVDETNKPNAYQGHLRFAPLDVYELRQRCADDFDKIKTLNFNKYPIVSPFNLAITCVDQLRSDSVLVNIDGKVKSMTFQDVMTILKPSFISSGPIRASVWNVHDDP